MGRKKVIYISGPITGVENYWEPFERAEEDLIALGYIPLNPAHLPEGMTNEQYMRINFAQIDSADAVLFLPGYGRSRGAMLELNYCQYTGKPVVLLRTVETCGCGCNRNPRELLQAMLKHDLGEVFKR